MKRNVRFKISYDGTRYQGWESQKKSDNTIQGKIEAVIEKMTGQEIKLIGAGRTDAGVHAKEMTANVFVDTDMNEKDIQRYMNHYLPEDISIDEVVFTHERFHSRYNAKAKTYRYTCFYGDNKPVFNRKYVYVLDYMPDIDLMKEAANLLKGKKDFAAFSTNAKSKKSTVRNVDSIDISYDNGYINFVFHGDGFLYNMVRILTGTLLEVGGGKRTPESVVSVLESKVRQNAGFTAPAQGLCLEYVEYD